MRFNTTNGFGTTWDNNKKQQKHQNEIQHSKLDMQYQAFEMVGNDYGETKQNINGQQQQQKLKNHWNEMQQMDAVEEYEKDKNQANEQIQETKFLE